ncbi:hypothetical protein FIBSPDRAFT_792544 [Athelia psychrophila]|uniref:Uncharacterized protein n=1 Tax=Athelia psychrophila TaxID=1759441 RepID=A0A166GMS5_9AGAM|nr:hypothetical protein FIBSPDRAFT_792544 [Fibularhizoctonia sp. CBS 109695]
MHPWVIYPVLSYLAHFSAATPSNRTIDDEFGDSVTNLRPVYSPTTGWAQGANCSTCFVQLDTLNVFDGSWHDTTHSPTDTEPRSVAITFNGTAVYAYCVLANTVQSTTTLTNLTFFMDGELVGTYQHIPTTSADYQYNVPVYVNTSLFNQQHVLTMEATGTNSSLILFDYVDYTFDSDPSPSSSSSSSTASASSSASGAPALATHHSNVGAIVGGVIGGMMMIVIVVLAFLLIRRRRRNAPRVAIDVDDDKPGPDDQGLAGTNLQATAFNPYGEVHAEAVAADSTTGFMTPTYLGTQPPSSAALSSGYGGPATSTSHYGASMPPGGMVVRSPPAPGSKAAQRQEEIARQVQAREEELAGLQRRQGSIRRPASSAPASSVSPPSSGSGAETDASMALEVERLKQEVDRLQTQQREMLWELNDAPPPVYE